MTRMTSSEAFVEQLVAEIVERVALFEKLTDLEQFDFHG